MAPRGTTGGLLKLLPESYRSVRKLIRALEVYVGHFLHDIFYEHAYEHIDAILPHKYWIPALFLGMCLLVQHKIYNVEVANYTQEKLIMSCDPNTITVATYLQLHSDHVSVAPPAPLPPPPPGAPAWYQIIGRLAFLLGALFSGLIIQHILIVLGLVFFEDEAYESAADKFAFFEGYGVGSETIIAFYVAQVVSFHYYECVKEIIKDPSRAADRNASRFFIKPFIFAFSFYLVRRLFRNLSGALLPSFDAIPLLVLLLIVSYQYILSGSPLESSIDSIMLIIRQGFKEILGLLYDYIFSFLIAALLCLYGISLVIAPPSHWSDEQILQGKRNPLLRGLRIFLSLLFYYAHWLAFHLRFDWWFSVGLGISMMKDEAFPSFLSESALPIFQAFRNFCWWFPFFDTSREMALLVQHPVW